MSGSAKALLLSILVMSILVPAWAARETNPRVGLRKAIRNMIVFNFLYVMSLLYLFPRL